MLRPYHAGAVVGALFLAGPAAAQSPTISGKVLDLSVDSSGRLLYCTQEREVGRIDGGVVTVLATAATGPFPQNLMAVVETPSGDVAVADVFGDIYLLPAGTTPATLLYDDLYLISNPSDLIVDAAGNFFMASATPSNQKRGINWISGDGQRWAYYKVRHGNDLFSPVDLAFDPLTGNILAADEQNGGTLQYLENASPSRTICGLDETTLFGFVLANGDGDMAVEANGDVLLVGGGSVYRYDRLADSSSPIATGFGQLRGIAIAASSGQVASPSGWSAYVAEGAYPTTIREVPDVGAPASLMAPSLGQVPNQGNQLRFWGQLKVYDMAVDNDGKLLVGGDLWGQNMSVRRVDLATLNMTVVAGPGDGILDRIEGIAVHPDGTIYALDHSGRIYEIHENPLSVTVIYDDAQNLITVGKDLVLDRSGKLYVADRESWDAGEVREVTIQGGTTAHVVSTEETRGLTADPSTGELIVSEWVNTGFVSKATTLDVNTKAKADLPGFDGFNLTNADGWGDGDSVIDVNGYVYLVSEDDWCLARWHPGYDGIERIGSMYLAHPSGIVIAPSRGSSSTGWSLYVAEFDFLWEIPNVAPPMPAVLDSGGPPVGQAFGFLSPKKGDALSMLPDPAGSGFLVVTEGGTLVRVGSGGSTTTLAGAPEGLSGQLRDVGVLANGHLVAVNAEGVVFEIDPGAGYAASVLFADPSNQLHDVRGLTVDGSGDLILVDRVAGTPASRVFRCDGSSLELLTFANGGQRAAIDPLTADVFVTESGHAFEPGGEVLRVETSASPAIAGHWRSPQGYTSFRVGENSGGIAFDSDGNFYIAEGDTGRVVFVDRSSGTRTDVAGNYTRPRSVRLAPGTPGIAGPQGTSLFVLDQWVVWEVGVPGLPAGPPPASNPGLAPRMDLRVQGLADVGAFVNVEVENASEAGKWYIVFPSYSGKVPGLPLQALGRPDPRVIPSNPDFMWDSIVDASLLPGFYGFLSGGGKSAPGAGLAIPNVPGILIDRFLDLTWVVVDGSATNFISYVGGTGQIYVGL